jgi:protein-tyrosine phosphatase
MNFSLITEDLFIGTTPSPEDYNQLRALNVGLILNMRIEQRPYIDDHARPIPVLWLPVVDIPLIILPIKKLQRGVVAALETLKKGGKIYAHCAHGVHRSVAMGACILIAQGHSPSAAMQLIKARRPQANPDIFHIRASIMRFAKVWGKPSNNNQKINNR